MLPSRLLQPSEEIEKREAAKRLHEYLLSLGEADEEDISGAAVLKDLYDCHVCVMHIAQMYIKGIMLPDSDREFGVKRIFTEFEYEEAYKRLMDKEKRLVQKSVESESPALWPKGESYPKEAKIVDVRSEVAFNEGHADGAINIPLSKLAINPHAVSNDSFGEIIFICDKGVNAQIAAEYAIGAGFKRVFYDSYC